MLFLLLTTLACALPAAITPPPPPILAPTTAVEVAPPLAGTPVPVTAGAGYAFAPYVEPPPPAVASALLTTPEPLDFDRLVNAVDLWPLNDAERAALAERGFIVAGGPQPSFYQIYQEAVTDNRPVFITADMLLYTCQIVLASTWAAVERDYLAADLDALVPALVEISTAQLAFFGPGGGAAAAAARQNLAYFSVAARLLDPEFELSPTIAAIVDDELTLIGSGSGAFASPLMGQQFDYRRLQPPPAYAGSEARRRYFQALTWLTEMGWPLSEDPAVSRQSALQALLLLRGLRDSQNEARWERLAVVPAFFRGRGAGLSVPELTAAAAAVYGDIPGLGVVEDAGLLDTFSLTLAQMAPAGMVQVFQFTPAPLFAADEAWPGLVFNQVGPYQGTAPPPLTALDSEVGLIRSVPRVFDLAALLGSDRAVYWLNQTGDDQYESYLAQRGSLAAVYTGRDATAWTQTLAGGWLYAQAALLEPAPGRLLPYDEALAWQDLRLNSWFGGWAQARTTHSSASFGPAVTPDTPAPAAGFVAPEPALFGRLAGLTAQVRAGLTTRALLDAPAAGRLAALEETLLTLQLLAAKEAAGRQLAPAELAFVAALAGQLAALTPADAGAAFTTNVFEDARGGRQLRAGSAGARPLYVLVPGPAGVIVAVGAVYDVYEWTAPSGSPPDVPLAGAAVRPPWTASFTVDPP